MKKRVLFIQQNLQGGGAEKVLVDILNNFDYDNYEVDLVVINKFGIYQELLNKSINVHYLMGAKLPWLLNELKSRGLLVIPRLYLRFLLNNTLGNRKYDTIISFMEGITVQAHYMVRKRGKKNVSWVHTDLIKNNWCLKSFRSIQEQAKIYHSIDEVVCVSNDAMLALKSLFHIEKCRVIYNIIDSFNINTKAAAYAVERSEKTTIITVGRLIPVKNQTLLVEAARVLEEKEIHADYWILGDGCDKESLEQLIQSYHLESSVKLLGFQSNPYPYIKSADIFVLTSLSEGFPLVICEAMCLGKPILSTRTTGPTELLSNGVGLLCEIDVKDFADKLEQLITQSTLRKELSLTALQASNAFRVEETMNKIYSII